jgi:hypothetical protein
MAKFLTTNGINYVLEEIIKGARERLVLISPFLRLNDRIKELLSDGYRPDVDMQIVYGKKELEAPDRQWLNTVPHIRSRFCQNLHAKCYLNESMCVITSLNLHLYRQQNNNEMGVMITRAQDHQLYADVSSEVDRLIRLSELTHVDRENLILTAVGTTDPVYPELSTSNLAKKLGIQTSALYSNLIARGIIQKQGNKERLTRLGKEAGGKEILGKTGQFVVWPADLRVDF